MIIKYYQEFKTPWLESLYSLNYQHHLSSEFTSLAMDQQRINQLRSASLNLLYQPRINIALASRGFRHACYCWPFPLEFHPSSSQIYRLLHSLQIQSNNSPFLWCEHLWPLAILSTRFWFDIIMLILRLDIILCYVNMLSIFFKVISVECPWQ